MIMFKKLQSLYPNSKLFTVLPNDTFYAFYNDLKNEWIGIPKEDLSEKELNILKIFFELGESHTPESSTISQSWYDFLFLNGELPTYPKTSIRLIQFQIKGNVTLQDEIESALKGFFSNEIVVIWENSQNGIVIENQKLPPLSEKELLSLTETFESDFYLTISFYIGKKLQFQECLPSQFQAEREYFQFGLKCLATVKIFTFERVFPSYLAFILPDSIKGKLNDVLTDIFHEDQEIFLTLKVFLESNSNASLAAKKLYIHRNTLQYRIDKFTDKTGLQLKDFYSAFTVFLSCLIYEQNSLK
jgi:DNA-binding PucR family transcriptional regulator